MKRSCIIVWEHRTRPGTRERDDETLYSEKEAMDICEELNEWLPAYHYWYEDLSKIELPELSNIITSDDP